MTILVTGGAGYIGSHMVHALIDAGAETEVVSPSKGKVRSWDTTDWGEEINVDVALESADPARYDALLLPGGVMNPDRLRTNEHAVQFVKAFTSTNRPVAAICHGPWTLIEAGAVRGRSGDAVRQLFRLSGFGGFFP